MFGLLKNLFGKKEAEPAQSAPTPAAAPASTPSAAPAAAKPAPAAPAAGGDVIELPLKAIVEGLPKDLQPLVAQPPSGGQMVKITVQGLSAQLGKGAVKISFGELRKLAGGTFQDNNAHDQTMVNLPLKEILSRVKPAQMTRRTGQKTIDIPDEIKPVFGEGKNAGGAPAHAAPAPAAAAPAPAPAPVAPPPPAPAPAPAPTPAPAAPAAPPPPAPATPIKSAAGLPDPSSLKPSTPAPAAPKPAPAPAPAPAAPKPAVPSTPAPAAGGIAAPAEEGAIAIALDALVGSWPEGLRNDLASHKGVTLQLPIDLVEPLMKKGKITFLWKQVRGWTRPTVGSAGAAHDETQVEIPLKLVIPLFMAARKPGATPAKKVSVGENIPDVFAKGGPAAAAPAAGLADIAKQIAALNGVAGAVIAMKDGLSVANAMTTVNADALCGFLPDMFNRTATHLKELNIGDVSSVTAQTGNQTLKIIKAGNLLLAVLSRPGEALPEKELTTFATQLAQQSK